MSDNDKPGTFEARREAFVAGLRALTRQTGVAVTSTVEGGAYYFEMVDAADCPRGQYLQDGTDLEWQADSRDYAALRAWEPSGAIGVLDVAMSRGVATATDAASKALFEPVDCGRMGTLISVRVPSIGPVTFRADENPMPYGDRVERHGERTAFVECDTCRAKPGSPVLCDDCLRRRREWCARVMITPFRNAKETD